MKRQKKRKYRLVRRMNVRAKGICFCGEPAKTRVRFLLLDGGKGTAHLCKTCDDVIDLLGSDAPLRWTYGMHNTADFREFIEHLRAATAVDALING